MLIFLCGRVFFLINMFLNHSMNPLETAVMKSLAQFATEPVFHKFLGVPTWSGFGGLTEMMPAFLMNT